MSIKQEGEENLWQKKTYRNREGVGGGERRLEVFSRVKVMFLPAACEQMFVIAEWNGILACGRGLQVTKPNK